MTSKQLRILISAGAFSAALLSGAAYADDDKADTTKNIIYVSSGITTVPIVPVTTKSKTSDADSKGKAHGCAGGSGCASDGK
jgi:hypothetical protein